MLLVARQRHLSKAPIQEALIDFRVALSPDFRVESFNALKIELAAQYPQIDEQHVSQSTFDVKGRTFSPTMSSLRGYLLKSADNRSIVQFRTDGFTFNRLPPYVSFEELMTEALPAWTRYVDVASPSIVTRVALRYINRLEYTEQTLELANVLEAPPKRPNGAPGVMTTFLSRISTHEPKSGIAVNLVTSIETPVSRPGVSVLIDIDAYKAGEFQTGRGALSRELEALRKVKNDVFFSTITEATAQQYE